MTRPLTPMEQLHQGVEALCTPFMPPGFRFQEIAIVAGGTLFEVRAVHDETGGILCGFAPTALLNSWAVASGLVTQLVIATERPAAAYFDEVTIQDEEAAGAPDPTGRRFDA
jgi:hypothetical protein